MVDRTMPFGERRLFKRKTCSRMIMINADQDSYSALMRNLTVGGAFIEPAGGGDERIGQELFLTIPFALKAEQVKIRAKVAWTRPKGMGVRFIRTASGNRSFR